MKTNAAILNVLEAADLLGVSPTTLADTSWRRLRNVPTWKNRNRIFFKRQELEAWLAAQVRKAE